MSEFDSPPRAVRPFIDFIPLLRANGFAVAPEQTTAFLSAIALLGPRDLEDVRRAGLATLAPPPERHAAYDALFDMHFLGAEGDGLNQGEEEDVVRVQEDRRGLDDAIKADEFERIGRDRNARRGAGRAPLRPGGTGRRAEAPRPRSPPAPAEAAEL